MKNVLFIIGDSWYPDVASANGACVYELVKKMKDKCNVYVASTKEKDDQEIIELDGVKVIRSNKRVSYRFRENFLYSNKKYKRFIYKVINTIFLPFNYLRFPYCDYFYAVSLSRMIKMHINKLDAIVITINPCESYLVYKNIKRKYKNAKTFTYFFDSLSLSRGINNSSLKEKVKVLKFKSVERKLVKNTDYSLFMDVNKKYYKSLYKKFLDHLLFIDIPLINDKTILYNKKKNDSLTFVYAGSFYKSRKPDYFCELFHKYLKNENASVKLFVKGEKRDLDCINDFCIKSKNKAFNFGYVRREIVEDALKNSDILVNIGTVNCPMIPCKIFEYMATGKKILHIVLEKENDVAIPYLEKYPNALLIYKSDGIENNIKKIKDFSMREDTHINIKQLKKIFYKNVPEYTCNLILKYTKNY